MDLSINTLLTWIPDKPYVLLTPASQLGWPSARSSSRMLADATAVSGNAPLMDADDVMSMVVGLRETVSQALLELRTTADGLESLRLDVMSRSRASEKPEASDNLQNLSTAHPVDGLRSSISGLQQVFEDEFPPHEEEIDLAPMTPRTARTQSPTTLSHPIK